MTTPDLTRLDPTDLITAALTGPCDGCNSSEALYMASSHERYCVACHTRWVMYEAAEVHLYALLEPSVTAWANHTEKLLTPTHLGEVLNFATDRLKTLLERSEKEPKVPTRNPADWAM